MSDTDEIQTLHALNDTQTAEIARLTAELEKCREDAGRLLFICNEMGLTEWFNLVDTGLLPDTIEKVRRAIDAARRSP